jgi:hypothetical protein
MNTVEYSVNREAILSLITAYKVQVVYKINSLPSKFTPGEGFESCVHDCYDALSTLSRLEQLAELSSAEGPRANESS